MVCKIGFTDWNAKIALLHVSMVVTYYIKVFWTGADRLNVSTPSTRRDNYGIFRSVIFMTSDFKVFLIMVLRELNCGVLSI